MYQAVRLDGVIMTGDRLGRLVSRRFYVGRVTTLAQMASDRRHRLGDRRGVGQLHLELLRRGASHVTNLGCRRGI